MNSKKEIYLIKLKGAESYLRIQKKGDPQLGERKGAPLMSFKAAHRLASDLYGPDYLKRVEVVEASISEFFSHIGRIGGKTMTPARRRALRRNARKPRPRNKPDEDSSEDQELDGI